MTPREKRLINALKFVKACPDIYYGRGPATVIESMKMAAHMALEDEWRRMLPKRGTKKAA